MGASFCFGRFAYSIAPGKGKGNSFPRGKYSTIIFGFSNNLSVEEVLIPIDFTAGSLLGVIVDCEDMIMP